MQIADVLIVNRSRVDATVIDLSPRQSVNGALEAEDAWRIPVLKTLTATREGLEKRVNAIFAQYQCMKVHQLFEQNQSRKKGKRFVGYSHSKSS
jgi:putative protein kinase ArgK-like GTPase of G3E family